MLHNYSGYDLDSDGRSVHSSRRNPRAPYKQRFDRRLLKGMGLASNLLHIETPHPPGITVAPTAKTP